ncbi:sensor histidine kinase [Aquibacillus koreensis]|uniref:histidine kinase n=1 Tax=Aquibacillus koreensis TaxID=279446 RepID=A0A9X3WM40_9BACI|nr:sensor histidine kinase [Aquibacillus koreensis]MCT2537840.1 sensor histidine kinase [Aquibacillus koreensis]MDC3421128.1 sensor histidine kinase [Aquibacillus koreensis]
MYGIQELLINFLFLIIFLLFTPIILELHFNKFSNRKRLWTYNISTSLAIISCILFPIPVIDGYIFDLRLVALTIGGLYAGIPSILLLSGVTVIFRFFVGGLGATATPIVVVVFIVLLITMSNRFMKSPRNKKVLIGTALSLSAAIIALVNSTIIFGQTFSVFFSFFYIIITICATALLIYLYEFFHESILIKKQLLKAEKMEIVSHLASSVVHEVKNPLTVVKGFIQLMLQDDLPHSKRKEYLKIALLEVKRADEIISDYLLFAKPNSENEKILNTKEAVQRTLQLIYPLASMNNVELETKVEDFYIRGEEQLFQQCLLNITKNCIEAMPNAGKLRIETQRINNDLLLMISDSGEGMTKEQLSRLGEPYFTTKGRKGTGLGMMVAINIIKSMNGKLNVKSEISQGTSFNIRIPLAVLDSPPKNEQDKRSVL